MTYDWEDLKPEICELYLGQNLTLDAVAEAVNRRHGVDIRNRTYREKLKEWGCRKVDHRGRRKSRSSAISADSGYASYSTRSTLSRTTTDSASSWHASTTTLAPSVPPGSPSIKSHHSDDFSFRSSLLLPSLPDPTSPPKCAKHKPLPPVPQSEPGEIEQILHRSSAPPPAPAPAAEQSGPIQPSNFPPHCPKSQCPLARRMKDIPRIATLGRCSECNATILHSLAAAGLNISATNFGTFVMDNQVSINARDKFGNTCLHIAAASGLRVDDFKVLQEAGADLLARNDQGEVFLHLIADYHKKDSLIQILEWAIDMKIDFRTPTFDGRTVLHALCERNIGFWALRNMWPFLRSFKTDINLRDRWGKTAVDYLKASLKIELSRGPHQGDSAQGLEDLLNANLPDHESRQGTNTAPLEETVALLDVPRGSEKFAQSDMAMWGTFCQSKNNPSIQNHDGRNALHCLAYIVHFWDFNNRQCFAPSEARHEGVCSALRWKVKVNAYDRHGSTPLHSFLAYIRINDCEFALSKIIETLLENGADPHMRDRDGNTALHLACTHGRHSCVDVLLSFIRKDARLSSQAIRARNDKDRSPVRETLAWMYTHNPEEKETRRQCMIKVTSEEFTEADSRPTWWGIPNSTALPGLAISPPPAFRPPTPMNVL